MARIGSWVKRGHIAYLGQPATKVLDLLPTEALRVERRRRANMCYGNAVPECCCTSAMSELFIKPLAVTSSRKLLSVTLWPDCDWVCEISLELTAPFPVVSPSSTLIGTLTFPLFPPPLTPTRLTLSVCALLTFVRFTVTSVLLTENPLAEPVPPAPGVMFALVTVTGTANVMTTL